MGQPSDYKYIWHGFYICILSKIHGNSRTFCGLIPYKIYFSALSRVVFKGILLCCTLEENHINRDQRDSGSTDPC